MKNFSSWLIAMFAFMFWGFRLAGTVMSSLGNEFMFEPTNLTMEVALLFITFLCICFIYFQFNPTAAIIDAVRDIISAAARTTQTIAAKTLCFFFILSPLFCWKYRFRRNLSRLWEEIRQIQVFLPIRIRGLQTR